MTCLSVLAGVLASAAAAYAQGDAQALLQQSAQVDIPHIITNAEYFALSESRVNATKYFIKDIFKKHGEALLTIMNSGPGDATASCTAADRAVLGEAMMDRASLVDYKYDSCAPDGMTAPEGFEHDTLAQCLQEAGKVTAPCQSCLTSFAKKIIGTEEEHGCNRRCVHWSAWCQDGYKDHCYWFMTECFDCAKQPVQELLQCVGFPKQDTLMSAYGDYSNLIKSKPRHSQHVVADVFVNAFPIGMLTTPYIVQGDKH